MSQPGQPSMRSDGNGAAGVTVSSEILVAAIIFLFMVVVFVIFLYLYAKRYWGANPALRRSRAHFVFAAADAVPVPHRGLDPQVLKALPVTVYRPADFKEGLECAVCLSELADGEAARLLPKCNHGFHLECIDMWFHSHSTCPLCRCPVGPEPAGNSDSDVELDGIPSLSTASADAHSPESPVFPTNVLFWGTQDRVNTGGAGAAAAAAVAADGSQEGASSSSGSRKPEGMLVIEIPRRVMEGFPSPISPLPSSSFPMEEMKSPASARLRSLRRLLSQGKRVVGSSCSPKGGDIEQGLVGCGGASGEGRARTPKTPMNS
ncbi:RING-H2 finger protein ATL3 [Elaeis guineensis]|uniref:RING-type E3 ubiquitin transferase n=1 Tax=Elaeis guineensis var. tenera TaxID=51953 RepID=A0A6I9QYC6_ELAGV|nr:RING-H2 finger protein ATL3 [Elaeis guineensis]